MKFRPENISERAKRLPMVKALVPLIAGILFFDRWEVSDACIWTCFVLLLFMGALTIRRKGSSVYLLAATFLLGGAAVSLGRFTPVLPGGEPLYMEVVADETVIPRTDGYGSTPATVRRVETVGGMQSVDERIMLWCDSTLTIDAGDRLCCIGRIVPFDTGYGGYARLMSRRGYAGSLFLHDCDVVAAEAGVMNPLRTFAMERMERLPVEGDERAATGAMSVGDRRRMTPELRSAYARSGASHVLAVSGLHVGIVFMLANTLLYGLTIFRHGQSIRAACTLIPVWIYAAICGFQPSVLRAAIMFTVLQAAMASTAPYAGPNTLAATAFAMLVCDADMLFDISFQLSFTAVAAIMFWGVPLSRLARGRNFAIRALWDIFAVGAVATAATAPIVSHTFGSVPVAGLILNPLIILCANITVMAAILWIVLPLPWLAPVCGPLLRFTVGLQNGAVAEVASWRWSAIEWSMPSWAVALAYALMAAFTLAAWCIEPEKKVTLPR